MITRTLGSILRGRSTPLQILMACVLGAMLGYAPTFGTAPGLIVTLAILLLVLNASIGLALLVGLLAKLIAWLSMPLTFVVGQGLLDGPTQGLFKSMINAPVLALFGFEYYLTTGGALIGLVLGLAIGLVMIKSVAGVRRKLAHLEENSERYKTWSKKWYVKLMLFLFVGSGSGKYTYAQLLTRKFGNPIRWWGAAIAVLVVGVLLVGQNWVGKKILPHYMKAGLEKANGATVDVDAIDLDLAGGRLAVSGLAMADPKQLDTDLLRAAKLEAQLNTADLLRKRIVVQNVVVSDASTGLKRTTPGKRIGSPPAPLPDDSGKGKTLDDYLNDAKVWKERLSQARQWLEKLSSKKSDPEEKKESAKEKLKRMVAEEGYAHIKADHLVEGSPQFLLVKFAAEKVKAAQLPVGETIDIIAENLSTQPNLVKDPPSVRITSSKDTVKLAVALAAVSATTGKNTIDLACKNIPGDAVGKSLSFAGGQPIKGGTIDFTTKGTFNGGYVDLPLNVLLKETTLSVAKGASAPVKEFALPIILRGALDAPKVDYDKQQLTEALKTAGANALVGELEKLGGGKLPVKIDGGLLTNPPKDPKDLLNGLGGLGERKPTTKPKR